MDTQIDRCTRVSVCTKNLCTMCVYSKRDNGVSERELRRDWAAREVSQMCVLVPPSLPASLSGPPLDGLFTFVCRPAA